MRAPRAALPPRPPAPPAARTSTRSLCLGLVCLLSLSSCSRSRSGPKALRFEKAPIILISVDTLRSDRLPMYGYAKVETPALSAFRRDSVLFEKAYSHIPLTLPSHLSLLTGLEPGQHGVLDNSGYRLDASLPTLAELLHKSGYATGGAVSAYVLRSESGIARGFDLYEERLETKGPARMLDFVQRPGGETSALLLGWIREKRSGPFLAFLHTYEPHSPYEAAEPFRSRYADAYDAEVAYSDHIVGGFLDELRKLGVYERALIFFLSDHGEGLGEHGEEQHGIFLYRESIQVPLLMKLPGQALAGTSVKAPVQLTDVFTTVGEALGLPSFPARPGTTSLTALASGGAPPDRRIFAENFNPRIRLGWSELRSLVSERYQFIEAPRAELYDLLRDPAEKENLLGQKPPELRSMVVEMERRRTAIRPPSPIDSEQAKKLQSLGYLTGSSSEVGGALPDPKDAIGSLEKLQSAVELHQAGRSAEAIPMLEAVLRSNPRLVDGWEALSAALEQEGRMDEALSALKKTAQLSPPGRTNYLVDIAGLALRAGRTADAQQHAELAWGLGDARAAEVLAQVRLREKDLPGARRWGELALERRPSASGPQLVLARIAMLEGRFPEALSRADEARRAAGEGSPPEGLHVLRAEILGRQDRLDLAEDEYRKELESYPRSVEALGGLAITAAARGDVDEAVRRVEGMVRLVPSADAYFMGAVTLRTFGLAARADALLGEGRRRFPRDPRFTRPEKAARR